MELNEWERLEPEQMNPRVSRRVIHSQHMTIARLELKKDAVVPEHHHINEQVSMVESGALKFFIEGREEIVRSGGVLTIPPNVPHGVEVLEDSVVVDVFTPPREDWKRGDDAYMRR
ncbi:MAG TPA: cupin domain-containing protein [Bryobacteraceae bacterium]|nr:cupin domain-containing protein [Bryobacteraceae bacterium]